MDNEVQRFKSWLIENSLPTGSIALWYVLYHTEQHSGEWFEAKNRTLQSMTGMSEKGLQKARKRLVDDGLIEYREQPRKAGEYRVLTLEVPQIVTQKVPQIVRQEVLQKVPQKVPQEEDSENLFANATKQFATNKGIKS